MAVRLFAVSDVHSDMPENGDWVEGLSGTEYLRDALIVAGDVSDDMVVLEHTLQVLKAKFATVFFTPGNHDLWLGDEDRAEGLQDSLAKLQRILELCRSLGVETGPCRVGGEGGVWVCPLVAWHHQSFDKEPDLEGWRIPKVDKVMTDFKLCRFPPGVSMLDDSAAKALDALNDAALAALAAQRTAESEPLVTFSHFLPRMELLLEKRFLTLPQLPKAAGSDFLRARVEALRPDLHVFGHTHFAWDTVLDGVRYVQAALAYPGERKARWHSLANGDFGRAGPLLIWSSDAGFAPKQHCRWSGYYEHHAREPHKTFELAAYAAPHFEKLDERARTCVPDFSHEGADAQPAGSHHLRRDPVAPA